MTLRDLMERAGLTPAHVEIQTGLGRSTIDRACGGRMVSRSSRVSIARALGVTADEVKDAILAVSGAA